MDRRNFLRAVIVAPMTGHESDQKQNIALSAQDELRELLFNSPHLFRFRAVDGVRAIVIFEGKQIGQSCTEFVAHPHPDKAVRGAVCCTVRDDNGEPVIEATTLVTEWKIGKVIWRPMQDATIQ